jgi:hypothetical protein
VALFDTIEAGFADVEVTRVGSDPLNASRHLQGASARARQGNPAHLS